MPSVARSTCPSGAGRIPLRRCRSGCSVHEVVVSKEGGRRFLATRQLLAPARSLEGGPEAVLEVFRRLGSLQLDPVAVAGLSHDLVLHARVADYEPAWC